MDLRPIEERLAAVLRGAEGSLPAHQLDEMISLVEAGEPGVALENFCTQLEEYDVLVPTAVARELKAIAAAMQMPLSKWIDAIIAIPRS